jgi:hypothetical protein
MLFPQLARKMNPETWLPDPAENAVNITLNRAKHRRTFRTTLAYRGEIQTK